jgi:pimeloyl-ACP methyl ester carboxylesterase
MAYVSDAAQTRHVDGKLAHYAYRDFGQAAATPPLVLLQRFRATLDHWDPAFLEPLARERRVILFDSAGIGESTGTAPDTVAGMAGSAVDFIHALGLPLVDMLGWSLGGFVAQIVALQEPALVRRLVITGSGPGGVPGTPELDPRVPQKMTAPVNADEDYLYLFFGPGEDAQARGVESLRRLDTRLSRSHAEVSAESWGNQLAAIGTWASGEGSAWSRLEELTHPTLVANGAHDVMVDSGNSFAMVQRMPNANAVFYGDAGHGFLFQHPDEFARMVLDFLR